MVCGKIPYYKMDIKHSYYFNKYIKMENKESSEIKSCLDNEIVIMNIAFQIQDINSLHNMYLTRKLFAKLLNNPYVTQQLAINFGIKSHVDNFVAFIKAHKYKLLGAPPIFDIRIKPELTVEFNHDCKMFINYINVEKLPFNLRWDIDLMMEWIAKLNHVQLSDKILRINAPPHIIWKSNDETICWNNNYTTFIINQVYTPDEKLFNFINNINDTFLPFS